jgi:hypothetical protein
MSLANTKPSPFTSHENSGNWEEARQDGAEFRSQSLEESRRYSRTEYILGCIELNNMSRCTAYMQKYGVPRTEMYVFVPTYVLMRGLQGCDGGGKAGQD